MATYLAYITGGTCKDTHAEPTQTEGRDGKIRNHYPQIRKQFWVREELRRMGIEAWCGDRIDFRRKKGNHRTTEAVTTPALPNYMFIDMDAEQFMAVINVDHVAPTLKVLSRGDIEGGNGIIGLKQFKRAAEADFSAAQRVDANKRADVAQYVEGQQLRILSGPFMDLGATFEKMVRAGHDDWPRIVAEIGGHKVSFDPLDVRAG